MSIDNFDEFFAAHYESDLDILRAVYGALAGSLPHDLAALHGALESTDRARADRLCHKIGGGLSEIAATESMEHLQSLRAYLGRKDFDVRSAVQLLTFLRIAIEGDCKQLRLWLERRGTGID